MNTNYYQQNQQGHQQKEPLDFKKLQQDLEQSSRGRLQIPQQTQNPHSVSPGGLSAVQMRVKAMEDSKQQALASQRAKTPTFTNKVQLPTPKPIVHTQVQTNQVPQQQLNNPEFRVHNNHIQPVHNQNKVIMHQTPVHQPAQTMAHENHPINRQPAQQKVINNNNTHDQQIVNLEERTISINERIAALQKKNDYQMQAHPINMVTHKQPQDQSRLPQQQRVQQEVQRISRTPQPFEQFKDQNNQFINQIHKPVENRVSETKQQHQNHQQEVIPTNNVKLIQQRMQQQQQQQMNQFQPKPYQPKNLNQNPEFGNHQPKQYQQIHNNEQQQIQTGVIRPSVTPDARLEKSNKLISKFDPNFLQTLNMQISGGPPKAKGYQAPNGTKLFNNIHENQEVSYEHLNKNMGAISAQLSTIFSQDKQKYQAPRLDQNEELQHNTYDRVKPAQKQQKPRTNQFEGM